MIETKKKTVFKLPTKKVTVKFIERATALVTDKDHVLYGGLAPNAYKGFQVPLSSSGGLAHIMEPEELTTLEKMMGMNPGELAFDRERKNFWHDYLIKLDKNVKQLDLSNARDYIFYKVACSQPDFIANTGQPRLSSTQWKIIDAQAEEHKTEVRVNTAKKAFMILGKIENNEVLLRQVLLEHKGGARIPESKLNSLHFLQQEAGKLAESDPTVFVSIANDPDLEWKGALHMGVKIGAIKKKGRFFYLLDEDKMALAGDNNELKGAVAFLKAPENSEFYMKLIDQINNAL